MVTDADTADTCAADACETVEAALLKESCCVEDEAADGVADTALSLPPGAPEGPPVKALDKLLFTSLAEGAKEATWSPVLVGLEVLVLSSATGLAPNSNPPLIDSLLAEPPLPPN